MTKEYKKENYRFALFFDDKNAEFIVVVDWNFINTYIAKTETGKWEMCFGLNAHNMEKYIDKDGHECTRWNPGMPNMNFICEFKDWRNAKDGIVIGHKDDGWEKTLSYEDIVEIRKAIMKADKRIKFKKDQLLSK